jgi:hypothetical protein
MVKCRECREGKHGACNGDALMETGEGVAIFACDCGALSHPEAGFF